MTKSARARAFEAENGPQTTTSKAELVVDPNAASGTLLSVIDPDNPHPQPADIPEIITLEENPVLPEDVMRAFANIVRTQSMRGRIQGIDTMDRMTGATNRFRTETEHSEKAREHMDGKEIAFTDQNEKTKKIDKQPTDDESPARGDVKDILDATFGPGVKELDDTDSVTKQTTKQPVDDTEGDYDVLNNTKARLAAGEDHATVMASRDYIKFQLEKKLKTVPEHEINSGKRSPHERMNAKIRNAILADPHAVKNLLDPILLRSK